jgi:hypothetical protein
MITAASMALARATTVMGRRERCSIEEEGKYNHINGYGRDTLQKR